MSSLNHLGLLALSWFGYGLIHSLLAGQDSKLLFKKYFPEYFGAYRLSYNLLAGILLVVPVWLLLSYPGDALWHWPTPLRWTADTFALMALGGLIFSGGIYDTREFLGLSQLGASQSSLDDTAPMRITPLHRFVRHPWYFFGLVILWTREMNAALLVSAIVLTAYVVAGSWLEERKLIHRYGRQYRNYRKKVPGLIPLPWRYLSKQEAENIRQQAE